MEELLGVEKIVSGFLLPRLACCFVQCFDHGDNRGAKNVIGRLNDALSVNDVSYKYHTASGESICQYVVWLFFVSFSHLCISNKKMDVIFYFVSGVKTNGDNSQMIRATQQRLKK